MLTASASDSSLSSQASDVPSLSSPSEACEFAFSTVGTPDTEQSDSFPQAAFPQAISDTFVLVVGGLGYIGSHTSWELLKSGQNVVIIDNLYNSRRDVFDKLLDLRNTYYKNSVSRPVLDFYQIDYRDKQKLQELLLYYEDHNISNPWVRSSYRSRIRAVIHFAAYKAVAESFQVPLAYYANNVSGLIDFCSTLGEFNIKKFVFSSSATVYGELANKGGRLTEEQCDSSRCSGLTNPYGRTKWMCEAILSDLVHSDPSWKIVALRYFNPIGCDESGMLGEEPRSVASNLMPVVVRALTGEIPSLDIFGTDWNTPDGTAIRDFIHVSDLAEGHLAAVKAMDTRLGPGYHVYNLGTGTGHSVKEIVHAMEQSSARTIPVRETSRREGDVGMCIADPAKSITSLGWQTQRSLARACWDICRYIGFLPPTPTHELAAFAAPPTEEEIKSSSSIPSDLIDSNLVLLTNHLN